jgi:hypothetical protein
MAISVRSYLAAGVATAAIGAIAVVPVEQTAAETIGARLYQLSASVHTLVQPANAAAAVLGAVTDAGSGVSPAAPAAAVTAAPAAAIPAAAIPEMPDVIWPSPSLAQSAGDFIINVYNALEPWFQWGWSVVAWAAGWVPIVGFFAQQINIAYATIEPLVQAVVYSFAYLIDGQAALIPDTLVQGVAAAWNNFVQGEIYWFESFLPPLPPLPFLAAPASAVAPAAALAAEPAEPVAEEQAAEGQAGEEQSAPATAGFKESRSVAAATETGTETPATETPATETPAIELDVEPAPVSTDAAATSPEPSSDAPAANDSQSDSPPKAPVRAGKGSGQKGTGHSARGAAKAAKQQ